MKKLSPTYLALAAVLLVAVAGCTTKPKTVAVTTPPATTTPAETPAYVPPTPTAPQQATGARPGSEQDFVVNVGDRVFFDTDQSSLRPDAAATITAQAAWLVRYPSVKVRIEGNADERGTREYNFALGARRAQAVIDLLVSKGVVPGRITSISYGKESPIDTGEGEGAWAKNRNAHTTIVSGAL